MGHLVDGLLIAAIVVGSRNLENFDPALVIYTFAVIFATWGVVYHYYVWLDKPPTRFYWERGWQLFRQQGILRERCRDSIAIDRDTSSAQTFIRQALAASMVDASVPLLGLHARRGDHVPAGLRLDRTSDRRPDDQMMYVTYLFGFPVGSFRIRTMLVLVHVPWARYRGGAGAGGGRPVALAADARPGRAGGCSLSAWISSRSSCCSRFPSPGLALTASTNGCAELLTVSSPFCMPITVIAGLLYLPFGKFFHIFQRPAQLGVKLYQAGGRRRRRARFAPAAASGSRRECTSTI